MTLPPALTNLQGLYLSKSRLTSSTLPDNLKNLQTLFLYDNPLESLHIPLDMDIENHALGGFPKSKVTFYNPAGAKPLAGGILEIVRVEGGVRILWQKGTQQSTTDLNGDWGDLDPAQLFFRLKPAE